MTFSEIAERVTGKVKKIAEWFLRTMLRSGSMRVCIIAAELVH